MIEYSQNEQMALLKAIDDLKQKYLSDTLPQIKVAEGVEIFLQSKQHCRPRTRAELRGVLARLLRQCPELPQRHLSSLSMLDCEGLLLATFASPRQRAKGWVILHALFEFCYKRGWVHSNPVKLIPKPTVQEKEIVPLCETELKRLTRCARRPQHRACMPALGLMLWAGLRPAEVERATWQDVDWEEKVIIVRAQHAKTGGCRHVSITTALRRWLQDAGLQQSGRICPPDWARRWKALRRDARLLPWRQDVLRHTFASYHIKQWHDYARLQHEMGHRSAELLRTRYLSMQGVKKQFAKLFWQGL